QEMFSEDSAGSAGSALNVVSALRRCRQPVPARVAVADGRPGRGTTDRRGFAGGTVPHSPRPGPSPAGRARGGRRGSGGQERQDRQGGQGGKPLSVPSSLSRLSRPSC